MLQDVVGVQRLTNLGRPGGGRDWRLENRERVGMEGEGASQNLMQYFMQPYAHMDEGR